MAKKKRISSNGANNASNGSGNRPGSTGSPSSRIDGTSLAADSLSAAKSVNTAANTRARPTAASSAAVSLPLEVERGDWTVVILALMMFLAPAVGVPNEYMLQDTLKSIVVSFMAVSAALLFFWRQRNRRDGLRWHGIMWLPLSLMAYALGSMVWSHTYLGGVEAIRWFIFSLMLWLGLNTLSRVRMDYLIEGIHWGAVVASLWAALQFWVDFSTSRKAQTRRLLSSIEIFSPSLWFVRFHFQPTCWRSPRVLPASR